MTLVVDREGQAARARRAARRSQWTRLLRGQEALCRAESGATHLAHAMPQLTQRK